MKNKKNLYERFHKKTSLQKRLLKETSFTYRHILNALGPHIKDGRKEILDIGCGTGTLSLYLASLGNYVKGIDISSNAIRACKINAKKLKLKKNTDFQEIDFSKTRVKKRFDIVLCIELLEHIHEEAPTISRIFSSLKDNGILAISVPSIESPLYRLGITKKFDRRVGHLRRYNSETLKRLLKRAGFKIVELKKREGIIRNFLFLFNWNKPIIIVADKFPVVSNIITLIDNIFLELLPESQIIIIAQKEQ